MGHTGQRKGLRKQRKTCEKVCEKVLADKGNDENIKKRGFEDTLITLKHEGEWMHADYE